MTFAGHVAQLAQVETDQAEQPTTDQAGHTWLPLSPAERDAFDRDGYLILRNVLTAAQVEQCTAAIDRVAALARERGQLSSTGAMHLLSAVTNAPELAMLIDQPATLRYVWSLIGWNVHLYHSHIDVHPPLPERQPPWWHWHQDGGRQNRELETDPRPRLSVKVAYWFSDVTEPGRGNLTVVPGSHRLNWLPGPSRRGLPFDPPAGAVEVLVGPGDAIVFDRRLWHARSDNYSDVTRMATFFGYTLRWIAIRDEVGDLPSQDWWTSLSPLQQQLLGHCGDGSGDHSWGHDPQSTPLYGELERRGLLDPGYPPLKP